MQPVGAACYRTGGPGEHSHDGPLRWLRGSLTARLPGLHSGPPAPAERCRAGRAELGLYGGYIKMAAPGQVLRVPYFGLKGSYAALNPLAAILVQAGAHARQLDLRCAHAAALNTQ